MSSSITDASQNELINLIYHHLKDNGYKKAARSLRKHAPQVETNEVKASLTEIFQKWASADDDAPPVPSGVQTPELQSPVKRKTGAGATSKITSPSAGLNPKKPASSKKTSGSGNKSQKENKKKKEPRKRKASTCADVPASASVSAAPGNDSDSDTSLDLEKWRKVASQLSDADRAKMDVLSVLDESVVTSSGKSTAKRKPRQPAKAKRDAKPAEKGKSSTPVKNNNTAVPAAASTPQSDTSKRKDAAVISEVKTPPKKTGSKINDSVSGHDVVETTKGSKAETTNSEVHDKTTGSGGSDSEVIKSPKKVHFKISDSISERRESPQIARAENGTSETTGIVDTPSKKHKKRKSQSEAGDAEAPADLTEVTSASSDILSGETSTTINADQSETLSRKVKKSKKSKHVDEVCCGQVKAKRADVSSETESEAIIADSSCKQGNKELVEPVECETPSKKGKAKKVKSTEDPGELETPGKQTQTDADVLQSDSTDSSLKKKKSKTPADGVQVQNEISPDANEDTSSQEVPTPKRKKHKIEEEAAVKEEEEAEPKKKKRKKKRVKEDEDAELTLQTPEEEAAASVPVVVNQKKKKKKKKEKEREAAEEEDVSSVSAPPEEVLMHKKKKKSSKEKQLSNDEAYGLNST